MYAEGIEKGKDSLKHLKESLLLVEEGNQIGNEVLENLNEQRDHLNKAQQNLDETDNFLGKGRKILHNMQRKAFQNRLTLHSINVTLFISIILVLYFLYFHHTRRHNKI
eukprot:snap_masked-scaffold_15-processed-gene-5.24-mRNA-1 protein AED:0.45 eAED:1.00 QI:0/-1/0/1/-1/1/1/0/108